jgi:hypothetical protein
MTNNDFSGTGLPPAGQIRQAIALFLDFAYGQVQPDGARRFIPPDGFDPARWLMSELIERDPPDAPMERVRSFVLRIGNSQYPHMKLRLSRPPRDKVYLFSVDSHDAFLSAPAGSADHQVIEDLKAFNAQVAATIRSAWDRAGLATEANYLRGKITEGRTSQDGPAAAGGVDSGPAKT